MLAGGTPALRLSEESRDALFQYHYSIFNPSGLCFLLEQLQRLIHRLVGEPEASVVHRDHPASLQIEESSRRICGAGMHVAEIRRMVSANRKQRQLRGQTISDLAKSRKVSRVARVVDGVMIVAQHVSAIAAMRVFQHSRAPMPRRHMSDGQPAMPIAVPPIEFDDIAEAEISHQVEDVMRNDNGGRRSSAATSLLHDGAQRRPMKMIEMRVCDQHQIDRRKISHLNPWLTQAL